MGSTLVVVLGGRPSLTACFCCATAIGDFISFCDVSAIADVKSKMTYDMPEHEDWSLTTFFQLLEQHQGLFIIAQATLFRLSAGRTMFKLGQLTGIPKTYKQRIHFPIIINLILFQRSR